jgi:hypothetical protein
MIKDFSYAAIAAISYHAEMLGRPTDGAPKLRQTGRDIEREDVP